MSESKKIEIKIVSSSQGTGTTQLPLFGSNQPSQIPTASMPPQEAPSKEELRDASEKTVVRKKSSKRKRRSGGDSDGSYMDPDPTVGPDGRVYIPGINEVSPEEANKTKRRYRSHKADAQEENRQAKSAAAKTEKEIKDLQKLLRPRLKPSKLSQQLAAHAKRTQARHESEAQRTTQSAHKISNWINSFRTKRNQTNSLKNNFLRQARTTANRVNAADADLAKKALGPVARRAHASRMAGLPNAAQMNAALGAGGSGAAGAGAAALLGPAAAATAAAITALGAAAAVTSIAIHQVDEIMKGLVRSASAFHGPLAATVATVEVARLQREMHRASVLGDDLTKFASLRGEIALSIDDAITNVLQPMLPHIVEATDKLATIANIIEHMASDPLWGEGLDLWRQILENNVSMAKIMGHAMGLSPIVNYLERLWEMAEDDRKNKKPNAAIFNAQQALLDGRIAPSYAIPILPHRSGGMSSRIIP